MPGASYIYVQIAYMAFRIEIIEEIWVKSESEGTCKIMR